MTKGRKSIACFLVACAAMLAVTSIPALTDGGGAMAQVEGRTVEQPSPQGGNVPGGHLGTSSDSEIWRAVRHGIRGTVSLPDKQAGQLIQSEGEACVCELTHALQESQPKVSRHLALMRDSGVVEPRREGTWMHYSLSPSLPEWARDIIGCSHARLVDLATFRRDAQRLTEMNNRPERICA